MSTSLAALLANYARESGEIGDDPVSEDPSLIGAEEITIVTDNTTTELEEALEETSEKVEKLEENGAGAEKILDAVESLESYVASISADREAGVAMTAQSAKYFTMGVVASLEAREIPALIFNAEVAAFQTSFESNESEDYSTEAEEKANGLLQRLWNMLSAAVAAIAESFKEFFTTLGKNAAAIKASGATLKKVGASVKGDAKEGKITIGKNSRLGEGASIDPAKGLDALKAHYTADVLTITKAIRAALGDLSTVLKDPTPAKIKAWEDGTAGKGPASKTVVLPGGWSLKYVAGVGGGVAGLSKAQFSIVSAANASAAVQIDPLTPAEIVALGGKVADIGALMETAAKEVDAIVKQNEQLLASAKTAVSKGTGGTPEEVAAARASLSVAKSAISANKGLIPTYVKHLGAAAKEAYAVGVASAKKYGAAAPAAAAGSDAAAE